MISIGIVISIVMFISMISIGMFISILIITQSCTCQAAPTISNGTFTQRRPTVTGRQWGNGVPLLWVLVFNGAFNKRVVQYNVSIVKGPLSSCLTPLC